MSYGKVALKAVENINLKKMIPSEAWNTAAENSFPANSSSIKKNCPRGAFLGLCEDGYINGVTAGSYTKSSLNKKYAIRAVDLLKRNEGSGEPNILWKQVLHSLGADSEKAHNSQMNVVLTLWKEGLIQ